MTIPSSGNTPPAQVPLDATSVPQLDLILGGGLTRGSLAIILGPPGSGKTTLASQIAFAAAARGEQVLLLTALSEPTTKLLAHLQSYTFFDAELIGNTVKIYSLQQFLPQGGRITGQEIFAAVRQTKASFVVLDGFQSIRGLEPDIAVTRQIIYDLGTRLSLLGTTILITTEADPRDPALYPEMTTGDTLIGLYYNLQGMRAFRSLEVLKVRGRAPLTGRHSITINENGINVFPRLESRIKHTSGQPIELDQKAPPGRVSFGLPELDALLNGGLTRHTSTLLTGSIGTGKTLLALQFTLTGIQQGEPALFLGFRETGEQLLQKAEMFTLGNALRNALTMKGGLTLQRWEPIELDPDRVATEMVNALERTGARRMVIDSIAELERAVISSSGTDRVPDYLAAMLATARAYGVTLLAIKEQPKAVSANIDFSADEFSVLAENVILLQQLAYHGQLHRVLSVLKLRYSAHDHSLREFTIAPPGGINVLSPQESGLQILAALAGMQGEPVNEDIPPINDSPMSER